LREFIASSVKNPAGSSNTTVAVRPFGFAQLYLMSDDFFFFKTSFGLINDTFGVIFLPVLGLYRGPTGYRAGDSNGGVPIPPPF
jgi:hypothetical protein